MHTNGTPSTSQQCSVSPAPLPGVSARTQPPHPGVPDPAVPDPCPPARPPGVATSLPKAYGDQPIATCTHSQLAGIPMPLATAVLDQASGQMLEHCQLRKHPTHKQTWDISYANKLGCLCQGIGQHPSNPKSPCSPGTNTFKPIPGHSQPLQ